MILKVFRIYELQEYSFMAVFKAEHNYVDEDTDLDIFVCSNDILCRATTGDCVPGQEVGRYVLCGSTPDPVSVVGEPPFFPIPEFTIYPNRVLETIASLADMDVYTSDPGINKNSYYRADTVAMIFNSEDLMNTVINMVARDVRTHVKETGKQSPDVEMKTYNEFTDDELRDYFFRS